MGMCLSMDRARSFCRSVFVLRRIERNCSCDRTRSLRRSRAILRATRLDPSMDAERSLLRSGSVPRWILSDRNCDRPRCLEESGAIVLATRLDPLRHRRRSCLRSASIARWISGDRNCDVRRCLEGSCNGARDIGLRLADMVAARHALKQSFTLSPCRWRRRYLPFTNIVQHQSAANIFRTARIASIARATPPTCRRSDARPAPRRRGTVGHWSRVVWRDIRCRRSSAPSSS
jgi:hypothetical protein